MMKDNWAEQLHPADALKHAADAYRYTAKVVEDT